MTSVPVSAMRHTCWFMQAEQSSVSSDSVKLQLTAENAALLEAKVTAEKSVATVLSQVNFLTLCIICHCFSPA